MCIRDSSNSVFYNIFEEYAIVLLSSKLFGVPFLLIFTAAMVYLFKKFNRLYPDFIRLDGVSKSPMVNLLTETLSGLSTIRAFGAQENLTRRLAADSDENAKTLIGLAGLNGWAKLRISLGSLFIVILPCLGLALLQPDSTSASFAALLVTYAFSIDTDFAFVFECITNLQNCMICFERCQSLLQIPQESPDSAGEIPKDWPANGTLSFQNYSSRYRPGLPNVLNELSLQVNPGEKVGVVGRTGAGKSSVILSLLRLIDTTGGEVTIDGVPHTSTSLKLLRQSITVIPQEPYCFNGTLRENLDPLSVYPDSKLLWAISEVGLTQTIEGRGGLGMEIKENGGNLSAGEKQLLSIARALLKKSKLVLLDEATSSIDPTTEEVVQKAIKRNFGDSTMLVIAHRLNTIMHSDRILVLANGRIAEYDSPEKLRSISSSIFAKLISEIDNSCK
eukprot:TRINITY_DN496_c0_g1_i3.p1 TRINITY_DN496_c0_g1~~TRINITY_DN496_c0_g1_i3.p1  ORF type:complete len:447 (-),score=67.82 TRINITY_DN496_c0_g1_i3:120-1460(-)